MFPPRIGLSTTCDGVIPSPSHRPHVPYVPSTARFVLRRLVVTFRGTVSLCVGYQDGYTRFSKEDCSWFVTLLRRFRTLGSSPTGIVVVVVILDNVYVVVAVSQVIIICVAVAAVVVAAAADDDDDDDDDDCDDDMIVMMILMLRYERCTITALPRRD